jgi:hypothetical protein
MAFGMAVVNIACLLTQLVSVLQPGSLGTTAQLQQAVVQMSARLSVTYIVP